MEQIEFIKNTNYEIRVYDTDKLNYLVVSFASEKDYLKWKPVFDILNEALKSVSKVKVPI